METFGCPPFRKDKDLQPNPRVKSNEFTKQVIKRQEIYVTLVDETLAECRL